MAGRVWLKIGLGLLALVAAGVAGAWAFRAEIVETAAIHYLTQRGVPVPTIRVERVGWRSLDIADLSLGRVPEVAIDRLHITYDPWALAGQPVNSVAADGVTLRLDLHPDRPVLGGLQPLLAGGGAASGPAPPVTVERGRLIAETPVGPVAGQFAANLESKDNGAATGVASFTLNGPAESATASVSMNAAGRLFVDGKAALGAGSGLWAMLGAPQPSAGTLQFAVTAEGETKLPVQSPMADLLRDTRLTAQIQASIEGVDLPGLADGVDGEADLTAELSAGEVKVQLRRDATVNLGALAANMLAGLPGDLAKLLQGPWKASIAGIGSKPLLAAVWPESLTVDGSVVLRGASVRTGSLRLALAGPPNALAGRAEVRTVVPGQVLADPVLSGLKARLPLSVAWREGGLAMAIDGRGSVQVDRFAKPPDIQGQSRIALTVTGGEASWTPGSDIRAGVSLTGERILASVGEGKAVQQIALNPGAWQVGIGNGRAGLSARGNGAAVTLVDHNVAVTDLALAVNQGPAGQWLGENIEGVVSHTVTPAAFLPLVLSGRFVATADRQTVDAELTDPGGALRLSVAVVQNAGSGGRAKLTLPAVDFDPNGFQPTDLLPGLADITQVSGRVEGEAALSWAGGRVGSGGTVRLRDLGFTIQETRFRGVSGEVEFDSLLPLSTPPGQRLFVAEVDPVVPLTGGELSFAIRPGEPFKLHVEQGTIGFAGSRLEVADQLFDPTRDRHDIELKVSRLDLEQLFRMVKVDGLQGTGLMDGRIPLRLDGGVLSIGDGNLAAANGGVVQFRSVAATEALKGGGEAVALMLQALEDFHYDDLSVSLNKAAGGDAEIGLGLLGRNPDVLDGHPFRFNINLAGNLDRIVAALRAGGRISGDLLRRSTAR